jgi:sarcosine oxidase
MRRDFEHVVAGLGGIGSAAAYRLARRAGREVLGLEQFELGHPHGASQDHSRIIRLSYHRPHYVALAKQAYRAWAEVEQEARERLVVRTGGLDLWPPGAAIPIGDYVDSLEAEAVAYERLDAAAVMARFPQFRLDPGTVALFQADAGLVAAARANAAHQRLARDHGGTLRERAAISGIHAGGGEIDVRIEGAGFRCRTLTIACGPWSNHALAHFGLRLPLTVTQEQVTYVTPARPQACAPGRLPIWIWMDDPSYYGFPIFGENAVKIGRDVGGREVTVETRDYQADPLVRDGALEFLRRTIPDASGAELYTKTCLYTLTPDRDFVIDTLPELPSCAIAIGAGHAFKFAALIGRLLSELAIDGKASCDLQPFSLVRPILREANPPQRFLV